MIETKFTEASAEMFKQLCSTWLPIHELVLTGNIAAIESLLQDNPDCVHSVAMLSADKCRDAMKKLESLSSYSSISCFDYHRSLLQEAIKPVVDLINMNVSCLHEKRRGGFTPLHIAVISNQLGVVPLLIAKGALVNEADPLGLTPFHYAAIGQAERGDLLDVLWRYGADVNQASYGIGQLCERYACKPEMLSHFRGEVTPILLAAKYGDPITIRQLVDMGGDGRSVDNAGSSVLHYSLEGSSETLETILMFPNDVNAKRKNGDTPLSLAVRENNDPAIALLLQAGGEIPRSGREITDQKRSAQTRMLLDLVAITHKDQTLVTQSDVDCVIDGLNCTDFEKEHIRDTVVFLLKKNKCTGLCERVVVDKSLDARLGKNDLLYESLIDLVKFFSQYTLLKKLEACCSSNRGHFVLGEYYLENKDMTNMLAHFERITLPDDLTECHYVDRQLFVAKAKAYFYRGRYNDVIKLLEKNHIPRDMSAYVVLIKSYMGLGYSLRALELIDKVLGWNRQAVEVIGLGIDLAVQIRSPDKIERYARLLRLANQDKEPALPSAQHPNTLPLHQYIERTCQTERVDTKGLERLLTLVSITETDINGNTALHQAVLERCFEYVDLLIKQGADLCAKNRQGDTPLHIAARNNVKDVVLCIVDTVSGEDYPVSLDALLNSKNEKGYTPFVSAIRCGHAMLSMLFLTCGHCDFTVRDEEGNTLLHYLAQNNFFDVMHELLRIMILPQNDKKDFFLSRNQQGETALSVALNRNYHDIAQLLLRNGVVVEYRSLQSLLNAENRCLIPEAIPSMEITASELADGQRYSTIVKAIRLGESKLVLEMLEILRTENLLQAFISTEFDQDGYACHIAAACQNAGVFQSLVDLYEQHDRRDILMLQNSRGDRVIDIAAKSSLAQHVDFLLNKIGLKHDAKVVSTETRLSSHILIIFHNKNWKVFCHQLTHVFKTQIEHMNRKHAKKKADLVDILPKINQVLLEVVNGHASLRQFVFSKSIDEVVAVAKTLARELEETVRRKYHHDNTFKRELKYDDYGTEQVKLYMERKINQILDRFAKNGLPSKDEAAELYAVRLTKDEAAELKIQGFKEAFQEALRYLFYVNLAISEGQVQRAPDSFDNASQFFQTLSPTLSGTIQSNGGSGMAAGLAFSLVNLFFGVMKNLKDEQRKVQAENIVQAFIGSYRKPDNNTIEELANLFAKRYERIIPELTVSLSSYGKLRLHEDDGVVVFARAVVGRIGSYIMSGRSEKMDESNMPFIVAVQKAANSMSNVVKTIIGNSQDIVVGKKMPIAMRCELATWNCATDLDKYVETDRWENGGSVKWAAHDIMCNTAIIELDDPSLLWYRDGHYQSDIGPIYATREETKLRGYKNHKLISDEELMNRVAVDSSKKLR